MKEGGKILVAYDGSDNSDMAVAKALEAAKANKGSVTLLYVYWDPEERRSDLAIHALENAEEDQGSRIFTDIEKKLKVSGVEYDLRVEQQSDIPKRILSVATKGGFDAIAIGTSGTGGKPVGPVYEKIKAKSKIPLLTA